MGFVIIDGRNNGYPCIPQLPEPDGSRSMHEPLPEGYFIGRTDKAPKLNIHSNETTVAVSMLVCGGKVPYSLYWNEARITAVYLNDNEKLRYYNL